MIKELLTRAARAIIRPPGMPRNVRLITGDGDSLPIELIYVGRTRSGEDVWEAVRPVAFHPEDGDRFTADLIPPHTTIRIHAEGY